MVVFDASATSEDFASAFSTEIRGRTFVITGAGQPSIGSKMATSLAKFAPAQILIASRTAKVEPVLEQVKEIDPSVKATFVQVDLSDHDSPGKHGAEGIEMQFSGNHVGHFLLTNLLVPALLAGAAETGNARVVNLTSSGYLISPLGAHLTWDDYAGIFPATKKNTGRDFVFEEPRFKSYTHIAATPLIAALDPELPAKSPAYLQNSQVTQAEAEYVRDDESVEKLWKLSEELVVDMNKFVSHQIFTLRAGYDVVDQAFGRQHAFNPSFGAFYLHPLLLRPKTPFSYLLRGRENTIRVLAFIWFIYQVGKAVWNISPFHPLSHIPGPKLAGATYLPEFYYDVVKFGRYTKEINRMHDVYDPIVRISPNELHYNGIQFANEIYPLGGRKRDKPLHQVRGSGTVPHAILSTTPYDLHRMRRSALAKFFSRGHVSRLEPKIHRLVQRLCDKVLAQGKEPFDVTSAFSCFSTDVISDYCFGESFGFLEQKSWEPNFRKPLYALLKPLFPFRFFPFLEGLSVAASGVTKHLSEDMKLLIRTLTVDMPNKVQRAKADMEAGIMNRNGLPA
ncbi:cytochrome P450 [Aspergillus affinis]|uniref:cytochrome P450 n=1 Tax=Aspergillus affinis TaxID=1070780 RepID=UPI0022FDBFAF|nr:cytochrome P450 [Aspergillus affinis]KAI9043090.1 cytochrome P450 [Aspergillus affinis]